MRIEAYTDGACSGNPGPGGWGVVLRSGGEERELSGGEAQTTNQRMELTAAIEALAATPEGAEVVVYSDSNYLVQGMREWLAGWKRRRWRNASGKPVANRDLWERLDALAARRRVRWEWVRGHAGHPENERADRLARAAIPRG